MCKKKICLLEHFLNPSTVNAVKRSLILLMAKRQTDQLNFAKATNVDRPWLSKVLSGQERFGARAIARILSALEPDEADYLLRAHLADEAALIADTMQGPSRKKKTDSTPEAKLRTISRVRTCAADHESKLRILEDELFPGELLVSEMGKK